MSDYHSSLDYGENLKSRAKLETTKYSKQGIGTSFTTALLIICQTTLTTMTTLLLYDRQVQKDNSSSIPSTANASSVSSGYLARSGAWAGTRAVPHSHQTGRRMLRYNRTIKPYRVLNF